MCTNKKLLHGKRLNDSLRPQCLGYPRCRYNYITCRITVSRLYEQGYESDKSLRGKNVNGSYLF